MVEQEAVNFEVASSSLAGGAIKKPCGLFSCQKAASVLGLTPSKRVWPGEPHKNQDLKGLYFYVIFWAQARTGVASSASEEASENLKFI